MGNQGGLFCARPIDRPSHAGEESHMDNPYQSPGGGDRGAARFRLGRVLLIAAGLLLLVLGPIVWEANRERRARQRAVENLRQFGEALRQYQAREQAEHAAPAEAAAGTEDD